MLASAHRDQQDRSIVIKKNRHRDHRDREIVIRAMAEA